MTTLAPEAAPQLRLPTFDGFSMDRIVVTFSGSIELNPLDPEDRAFYERLRLGSEVVVGVMGVVGVRTHKRAEGKDGVIYTSAATVAVHSLER